MEKTDKTLVLYKLVGLGNSATFSPLTVENVARDSRTAKAEDANASLGETDGRGTRAAKKLYVFNFGD